MRFAMKPGHRGRISDPFASPLARRRITGIFVTAFIVLSCTIANAANPSLGSIVPFGVQRGQQIEFMFNGARLGDAQQVLLYEPGIEVVSLAAEDDAKVKVTLAIAADCRLGEHGMRLRTAMGVSNLRTLSIGAMPDVAEVEPNSEFETPQQINLDVTVNGVVTNEDVDYYLINATKGQRITAEIEGIRLGNTFFDPYVAIMDMNRFEIASSDDDALVYQDGVASILAPEDGTYIVQVRESAYGGSGACTYRLHVGTFPRPRAVYPAGGQFGQAIDVRWLGDPAGERAETVTLPAEAPTNFGLFAQDEHGIAPSSNLFRLSPLENTLEAEPNNAPAEATAFIAPGAVNGIIQEENDVDCFKFKATKGQVFDIRVMARKLRSPLDSVLNVNRIGGAGVAGNDDSGGPDSYLRFTAPEDDEYVITIRDHLKRGGPAFVYRCEVAPVERRLTMGLPQRQQYVDTTVSVPKGNRTALLISASRADFGGELNLTMPNLLPGVTMQTVTIRANRNDVPVLLEAAPEAALAGETVDVVGRLVDESQNLEGHLVQMTSLVRGRNNIQVWQHRTERLALAVTDAVPFKLDIVQPQVPLVRGGTMNLRVVATRDEGYTAPIAIRMLYSPPGTGAANSISIAEGQNEATIPLNANGNAEVRMWKIVVTGQATVGNGAMLISTQLADLEVSEPFFSFAFEPAAVEQGQETDVVIKITQNKPFEGAAKIELLGIPNEVTAEPIEITKESTEAIFHVKTTANSPAGKHKTLLCRAVITTNGEPITHMIGGGELRIDVPLPPKADAPAEPKPAPKAEPMPVVEKRLTRLEQLRVDRQKAKEAAQAAAQSAAQAAAQAAEEKPVETPAEEPQKEEQPQKDAEPQEEAEPQTDE